MILNSLYTKEPHKAGSITTCNLSKFRCLIFTFFLIGIIQINEAQVKIGDNPSIIDLNSILELESNSKALILTRLTDTEMNSLSPLEGAVVFNINQNCIFAYDGAQWKNLCNEPNITVSASAPTSNQIGDFWFNSTNNIASIWNGTIWLPINIHPYRGNGIPNPIITSPIAGDIYVDETNGDLYTFDGTNWVLINNTLLANNGLNINTNTIQLGGALIMPTIITTDSTNTLAILGLQNITTDANHDIVIVDNSTGELKKIATSALIQQQQLVIIATEGQSQFNTPLTAIDINKIDVYRNGARIGFSIINPTTIEVENEATCFAGDEIRIVQIN